MIEILTQREPDTPISIIGYSLGGNILLKWLGETENYPEKLTACAAVSVPFDLHKVTHRLSTGFSRVYQFAMLKKMQRSIRQKYASISCELDIEEIVRMKTFREVDHAFTAPVHGFEGVDDYYEKTSSRGFLKHVDFPTLILHASDDPFMTEDTVPEEHELSEHITLELAHKGGHVGFVHGTPWRPRYYLEERIPRYIAKRLRTIETETDDDESESIMDEFVAFRRVAASTR
jgi:predicted alpha/beta-fold hydrolase